MGLINPGTSPGILTLTGAVPLGASGAIGIELGGTTVGTGYDRLNVSGVATLGGALVVDTVNTFAPSSGDRFAIMTFGSRVGNFSAVTLPTITGVTLDTLFTSGQTPDTLYVTASAPAPTTGDWTWVSGSSSVAQLGVYGTRDTASPSNVPGARQVPVSWIDAADNLWLFGGSGFDVAGLVGRLNDLWRFVP
ncbi:MAG: hypothetical protein ACE5HT_09865 [Gemmatimonadales bacterium]